MTVALSRCNHWSYLGQPPSNSTGFLRAKIKRLVLLAFVKLSQVFTGLGLDHGQDTGNRFADSISKEENA